MTHRLKTLGLSLIAILAMGAIASSAAMAAEYNSAALNTTLHGEQVNAHEFTVDTGRVECEEVTFAGEIKGAVVPAMTLNPTYDECSLAGQKAIVDENGCDYLFHANGVVDLVCLAGKVIEVTGKECVITVPAQNGLKNVGYANGNGANGKMDITIVAAVQEIRYIEHGAKCKNQTKETANGVYLGSVTLEGYEHNGNPVDITYF